jgi:hypothetical protein
LNRGYTLLWRKVWNNPVLHERVKRFSRLEAWLYLVNVMARGVDDPSTGMRRGEFVASYRYLGKAWLWSVSSVFKFMRSLESAGMILRPERSAEHLPERQAEHFIICNYEIYNPSANAYPNTYPNAKPNKYKEGLKEGLKEGKTPAAGAAIVDSLPSVDAYRLSEVLKREISARDPHSKASRLPDTHRWAHDIDKIIRVDGRRSEDVEAVIIWCQKDQFWGPNILSGRKLREKFDTLIGRMSSNGNAQKPKEPDILDRMLAEAEQEESKCQPTKAR